MKTSIRGLYCMCDTSLTPHIRHLELAKRFLMGGAAIVQLRDKQGPQPEAARAISKLKTEYPFTFIINDYLDLALDIEADGIHLGSDDLPIATARQRLGDQKLIGYSAHSLDEALAAQDQGADYVAFGAIFPTATKGPGHPVQGLIKLTEVVQHLKIPVVAIGGIGRHNVQQVLETGAAAFAMISGLVKAEEIAAEVRWYSQCVQ